MFFDKIIFCTCDLHLKLDILNTLNIIFLLNGLKNEFFVLQPFFQNLKTLKFLFDCFFIKSIQWICIFIAGGTFLLYKKFEINYMTLCIPWKKKLNLNTWLF
jgi:hypothetical protein